MRVLRGSRRSSSASPQLKAFLIFAAVFCVAIQYFRVVSTPDPSSFFFKVRRAYQRRYTLVRINEAEDFIARSWRVESQLKASSDPSICVAIATVQRNDARYFHLLVGSLLDGLSDDERKDILLLPFIANIDPHAHNAYNESWLHNLADEVLTYENVTRRDKARMRSQETPDGHEKKALFDYSYMLQHCLNSNAHPPSRWEGGCVSLNLVLGVWNQECLKRSIKLPGGRLRVITRNE